MGLTVMFPCKLMGFVMPTPHLPHLSPPQYLILLLKSFATLNVFICS